MPNGETPGNSPGPVLWITGGGSGMGRAVAFEASRRGYRTALSGRRSSALDDAVRAIEAAGGEGFAVPIDVSDDRQVKEGHDRIADRWGPVTRVVLSAGLNNPKRYWRDQSIAEFSQIVQTNLVASARVVDQVLPGMRESGDGVAVFVSSYSGWRFSPDAGVAYSASKTGLSALAESLNAQENVNGVRACHLCPGDVDTDFLDMRPKVPGQSDRQQMLTPLDIARTVLFVLDSPAHVCINELVITPTKARPVGTG